MIFTRTLIFGLVTLFILVVMLVTIAINPPPFS